MEKTHFRKAFKSPYLSSADIVGPTVLTVSHVRLEKDQTKKTKDFFNTAYFVEKEIRQGEILKPMILNATNSKTLSKLSGSAFIDDWNGIPISVYVDSKIRFGRDTVEGLRISPERPRIQKPPLMPNTPQWANAIVAFKRDNNFLAVEKHMTINDETKQSIMAAAAMESEDQNATD